MKISNSAIIQFSSILKHVIIMALLKSAGVPWQMGGGGWARGGGLLGFCGKIVLWSLPDWEQYLCSRLWYQLRYRYFL